MGLSRLLVAVDPHTLTSLTSFLDMSDNECVTFRHFRQSVFVRGSVGCPEGYSWWAFAFCCLSGSACSRHTGQQAPFSLTGRLHSAVGHDSTKQVTWASLHSQVVQESFFHRSPSVRSRPSLSVQSVLLRRASSLLICFRKLVMVFCMSETKSWKSLIEGSVFFLEVTVTFV